MQAAHCAKLTVSPSHAVPNSTPPPALHETGAFDWQAYTVSSWLEHAGYFAMLAAHADVQASTVALFGQASCTCEHAAEHALPGAPALPAAPAALPPAVPAWPAPLPEPPAPAVPAAPAAPALPPAVPA